MTASNASSEVGSSPRQLPKIKYIPLSYNPHNTHSSATHLILTLFPEWEAKDLAFVRFTDGITNTLLKCVNSTKDKDKDAVLLRAYGRDTKILIDRERECTSHAILSSYGLAPALLSRFNNGLLYRYVAGKVCTAKDLSSRDIYLAVAERLGEWHGVLPVGGAQLPAQDSLIDPIDPAPTTENNLWGILQKWTGALPSDTPAQAARKRGLVDELRFLTEESGLKGRDGGVGLIFGHCDLLNGNIIILPEGRTECVDKPTEVQSLDAGIASRRKVHFIDYEYATPCERAFDIANHFSEWGGFECDYSLLPTQSVRREFIHSYLQSYHVHRRDEKYPTKVTNEEVEELVKEVDAFRGLPGLYWGIWALIQDTISQIDFDYAAYADVRLGEYWAWKKAFINEGKGTADRDEYLRERRWAEE